MPRLAISDNQEAGVMEAREEGFYRAVLGQNPPEIAYWERGEWWLAGDSKPFPPYAVTRLVSVA
jgi:hypothetical protein